MSNNFAFNLYPAAAKDVRQQTDASVISEMVDCWRSWNWILTHQNVFIRMSEWSWANAPFFPSSTLFWKVNKAQETLYPWQEYKSSPCALLLLILKACCNVKIVLDNIAFGCFNYTFIYFYREQAVRQLLEKAIEWIGNYISLVESPPILSI